MVHLDSTSAVLCDL